MTRPFVHLSVHSEYSLVDSVVRIPALVDAVAAAGMPAVAVTDQVNLFAMVKFYRAAERRGLKPIVGMDALVHEPDEPGKPSRVTLLCRHVEGYRQLSRLVTRSYLEGQRGGQPQVWREWLTSDTDGLIALSGGHDSDIGRSLVSGRLPDAEHALAWWREVFGDRFYLTVQRTGRLGEQKYLRSVVPLAARTGTPLVASNEVRFLHADDFGAHEARVCIHDGYRLSDERRPRRYTVQQFLRTPEEMTELFSDLPEALDNTLEVAQRCNLQLELGKSVLPAFPVPVGVDEDTFLEAEARRGLDGRLEGARKRGVAIERAQYEERLALELTVISTMGFAGYFLIVADFVRWARENGVPVGPGRGSGAGSLVAYVLGITDVDPLEHELLFERFLNPERVSMPDFDIDFCIDGRDRVIDYVAERYGRDRVAQIITYGSMAARAVVRDVGRVLGHPYGLVDRIAKLIPMEIGVTLERALVQDEELKRLYQDQEDVRAIIDLARSLEGLSRNAGKHAGGVVIAPSELTEYTPLYCEEGGGNKVTQLDKDDVEAAGLVKFDFLGLRTLTIIDRAIATINAAREGEPLDPATLPMDDPETFALLKRCDTTAVFQLESRGMRDLVKRLQPDRFADIVALVALYRPGPLQSGMVDDFIRRKHGEAKIDYPHDDIAAILQPTYGVILYQEQVMQIAQVLAGYSLGGADLLRRAMGKKKAEEMAKQRSVFMDGARGRGVEEATATHIFDLMEKFAGYGFNKSHSVAYAVLSYQTAWIKAHYPAAFMAAVLSADMEHTDKIVRLIDACNDMGLIIAGPDVNHSMHLFATSGGKGIRYGLGAVKGVGQGAVEAIIAEREASGAFADLEDFCRRIDLSKANRRVLEALLRAGAMDALGPNRATLMAWLPEMIRAAEQSSRASAAGQSDLFGLGPEAVAAPPVKQPELAEWSEAERLAGERDTLGLYLTGHPFTEFEQELKQVTGGRIADYLSETPTAAERERSYMNRRRVSIAGLVVDLRKRGGRLILTLDDRTARIEVSVFEEVYRQHRNVIAKDVVLLVEGNLRFDDYIDGWRVTADRLLDLDEVRERYACRLDVLWRSGVNGAEDESGFVYRLREILTPFCNGRCRVEVCYHGDHAQARLALGEQWQVRPTGELIAQLHALVGVDAVHLAYRRDLAGL